MADSVDLALQRAGELIHSNWLHAVHLLQEATQEHGEDFRLQSALGDIFFQKLQFDKAVQFYLVALSLEPINQELPAIVANCYLALQEYRLALAYYKRIINPTDEILYNKALTLAFLGQNAESVEILERVLPRYTNHPLIYYLLVEQSYFSGDLQKALKYAKLAEQRSSEHFQRHIMTAIIYHDLGNNFLSYNYFRKADALSTIQKSEQLLAFANTARKVGLWQHALEILERCIQQYPNLSEAWEVIIHIHLDKGNYLMAQRYLDKAYKQFNRLSSAFRLLKKRLDSLR